MRKGWEIKKLGEVCEFYNGQAHENNIVENGKYILVNSKFISSDATSYKRTNDALSPLFRGDIVMVMSDVPNGKALAKCFLVDKNDTYTLNQRICAIRSKNFDLKFLLYQINRNKFLLEFNNGENQTNLRKNDILSCPLLVPTLPEQKRIVSILDEAFAAIDKAKANAEKNMQNAKELFESYLQSVFENKGDNWEEKTLGEVCDFTQGIQRDVNLQSEIQKRNQVRFLRIVDFTQGNEPPRFIDNPGEKYILNENDVSLVRYGASTGFVCRGLAGALANNLFRVIPKSYKEITNDFLFIFLQSSAFQNVIKESMNGAAMPAISFGLIRDIPIPIMPLKAQNSLVTKNNRIQSEIKKLETIYQQKLDGLEELKKSILQKAFSGELTKIQTEISV